MSGGVRQLLLLSRAWGHTLASGGNQGTGTCLSGCWSQGLVSTSSQLPAATRCLTANASSTAALASCRQHTGGLPGLAPFCRQLSSGGPTDGAPPQRPSSRLATWKGPAGQPPPLPPPGIASAGAAAAQAAGGSGSEVMGPLTWLGSHHVALAAIPPVPKLLGFAGAIPFMALTPYIVEAAGMHALVDQCAKAQVAYGALIVTFLGAVHWGLAMTSTLSGPRAAATLRERYVWSVFPALAAWPVVLLETGPASLAVTMLLGICYLSDRSYGRLGSLPKWYVGLRGYLTAITMISMASTTFYYVSQDLRKAKARMDLEDEQERQRQAAAFARYTLPLPPLQAQLPAAAAAAPATAKKGWFK